MKLLWLGTSNDAADYLPEHLRAPQLAGRRLGEALETDVEVVVRGIWPTERLPSLVESWMEEHEPDLVFMKTVPYWFCYESVPLKIQRRFGTFGKPVADVGLKAAEIGWLASNPLFHAGRRLAQRTIGGATHFEPQEVVDTISTCIRVVLRSENTSLLVRGPRAINNYYSGKRARIRSEARRQFVHRRLRALCDELHVAYAGTETRPYESRTPTTLGDRVHYDRPEQELRADEVVPLLMKVWARHHPAVEDTHSLGR